MKRILGIMLVCLVVLMGCGTEAEETLFTNFKNALVDGKYDELYSLLSQPSQQAIEKEEFIIRYENIYSGIGASNFEVAMGEIDTENKVIPFTLSMDTVAGSTESMTYTLPYVKEEKELRITWSDSLIFPMMQDGDKVRVKTEAANRGSIIDRNGALLASDGAVHTIGIHPAIFDESERELKITQIAAILDISKEKITSKLDANKNPDHFVPLVDTLPGSPELEALKAKDFDGVLIQEKQGRVYLDHKAFGRLVGFIAPITAEELEKNKDAGYESTSLIGKAGLEQLHESTLKGTDGIEVYIEREEENIETLAKLDVAHGKDLKLSIDSTLQVNVYETMDSEKGSAAAVDPKTGEVLALVSSPSYNSNDFTTYRTNTEANYRESIGYADETNRFTGLYSPGSTFKLITAAAGLENGTLDPNEVKNIVGSEWQADSSWGNYNIRRINSQTDVALKQAVKYSDNIYFAMNALDMGPEMLIDRASRFGIGQPLDIGYAFPSSQISNDNTLGSDILLADTGYGQGQILVTSLNMAMAYSALSNDGSIMNPTLVVNDNFAPSVLSQAITPEHLPVLQDVFTAVISDSDGTGNLAKVDGVTLAGKTGTAELKKEQGERGAENGWFVATDLDSSKISLAIMIEDVHEGLGTLGVVEMVGDVLEDYLP